jgi:hypothetical protein
VVVAGSLGAGAHLQVPNKLYEYLGLRKPIVAAVDERSPVSAILNAANARASVCSPGDASSIALSIERIMSYRQDRQKEWSGIGSFDRALRAAELAEVFDALTQPAVRPRLGRTMSFPAAQLPAVPIVRPGSLPRQARSECSMPR